MYLKQVKSMTTVLQWMLLAAIAAAGSILSK